jgi:hypothetical protein
MVALIGASLAFAARRCVETAERLTGGRRENLAKVHELVALMRDQRDQEDRVAPDDGERVEDDADDLEPDDSEQTRRSDGA